MDTLPQLEIALRQLDEIVTAMAEVVGPQAIQRRLDARAQERLRLAEKQRLADYSLQMKKAQAEVDTGVVVNADAIGFGARVFCSPSAYFDFEALPEEVRPNVVDKKVGDAIKLTAGRRSTSRTTPRPATFTPTTRPCGLVLRPSP